MNNKNHRRVINPNFTNEEWYSNEYILSNFPKYKIFVTAGSRGRGKTYSGKNLILNRFNKRHKKKFAWIRLNDEPIQNMLSNNGSSFFEPSLLRKKKIGVKTETGNIYFTKDVSKDKDKQSWQNAGRALSLQKYADWKGNDFEDTDLIIIDELVRAETQKKTFDIPSAFINTIENICRERTDVMILIYCNTIGEMSEIRDLFGFLPMPGNHGVFKLPHKETIIEYLDDSLEWKRRKSKTLAGILIGKKQMAEFTNYNATIAGQHSEIWPRTKVKRKQFVFNFLLARNYIVTIYSIDGILWMDWQKYSTTKEKMSTIFSIHQQIVGGGVIFNLDVRNVVREAWWNNKIRFADFSLKQDFLKYATSYKLIT